MKSGVTNTLKFKRLKRLLQQPDCMVAGVLEMLWGLAVDQARMGDVGRFTNEEIATAIDWPGDADELVAALTTSEWIDSNPICRLLIHDWVHHAPQFVTRWIARELGVDPKGSNSTERTIHAWLVNFGLANGRDYSQLAKPEVDDKSSSQIEVGELPHGRGSTPPQPNPPHPLAPPPATSGGDSASNQAWKGVEEDLRSAGVRLWREAAASARSNGCTTDAVVNVIGFWRLHPGAWDAGALFQRVSNMLPGEDCSDLWPEKSPKFEAAKRREDSSKLQAKASSNRQADELRKADDQKKLAELEAEFGQKIDGLSDAAVRMALRSAAPGAVGDFMLKRYSGGRPVGTMREAILTHFSENREAVDLLLEPP